MLISKLELAKLQGLIYIAAGTIVFYTAAISCLVETPSPRYRVPIDGLIVVMLFLGTALWKHLVELGMTAIDKGKVDQLHGSFI